MKRRQFLTTAASVSALASIGSIQSAAAAESARKQEYYELRIYHFEPGAGHELLDSYLEKALIPGLNRLGIGPVGVFTEMEPNEAPAVYVLIPYPSLAALSSAGARLNADGAYRKAGAEYLGTPKSSPAFQRIESYLMLAFSGMPRLEVPKLTGERKPRIFELRTYESYSEQKAAKKVEMFNAGEIEVMREVGLGPVFYGQVLIGNDLPHLTYMLSGANQEEHKQHWRGFGSHPVWNKLKNDPQYADTVSKIRNVFLKPAEFSRI